MSGGWNFRRLYELVRSGRTQGAILLIAGLGLASCQVSPSQISNQLLSNSSAPNPSSVNPTVNFPQVQIPNVAGVNPTLNVPQAPNVNPPGEISVNQGLANLGQLNRQTPSASAAPSTPINPILNDNDVSDPSAQPAGDTVEPGDTRSDSNAVLPPPSIDVANDSNQMPYADPPTRCRIKPTREEANLFKVILPNMSHFEATQATGTLCWAACTQMVLAQHGIKVDQETLGAEFRPDKENKSANVGVILRALNPDLEPRFKDKLVLPIELFPVTSDQMIQQLLNGDLVVVGLVSPDYPDGHVCIVYGATFAKKQTNIFSNFIHINTGDSPPNTPQNQWVLSGVELFDPWPGNGSRPLTGADFAQQVKFITSRPMARQILLAALNPPPQSRNPGASNQKNSGGVRMEIKLQKN
jgi:hypothetical protein